MALIITPVSRCLDKKILLFGFEAMDVLIIFLFLSILNLIFGQLGMRFLLVWIPTCLLAAVLYFGKKGKPENFLLHYIRFQFKPGTYSAFPEPKISSDMPCPSISRVRKEVF